MSVKKRWLMVDGKLLPEDQARVILDYRSGRTPSGYQVMPDIADPFISPVDGTTISSRRDLREHNIGVTKWSRHR